MQKNHYGGWKVVPWFFLPNCEKDHNTFHRMCERARIDFRHIPKSKSLALIVALKAILIGMWMVVDMLENHLKSQLGHPPTDDRKT
jgi:hypothetical protein